MVGASPAFRELVNRIQLVASTSATVLIQGETGTGKELVVRAIHNLSDRRDRPLVKVNCAAISAGLIESELFGHVKGAFTGALERRVGRFEYANGGTLFLDEVTELPLESQAKLLRVLQEQEFEAVGSNKTMKVDVRLLAATNRNLADAVREGRFRMDLVLPAAGGAGGGAAAARAARGYSGAGGAFCAAVCAAVRAAGGGDCAGDDAAVDGLRLAGEYSRTGECAGAGGGAVRGPGAECAVGGGGARRTPPRSLEEAERRHIENTLASTRWVLEGPQGAAAILGLNPSTLRSRMKRLGISRPA